eukprot:scaffold354_cov215-Alexandrium_tamarense.AAC.4
MLAHRLIAAVEIRNKGYSDGREVDMDFEERGKDILNKMLTTLTQSLGLLLPSNKSVNNNSDWYNNISSPDLSVGCVADMNDEKTKIHTVQ